jgi:hypothetical protein
VVAGKWQVSFRGKAHRKPTTPKTHKNTRKLIWRSGGGVEI